MTPEELKAIREQPKPQMDDDTLHLVACEVSHDLRHMDGETGIERVRWNNRSMLMAVNRCEVLKAEVTRLQTALSAERERCAKACESNSEEWPSQPMVRDALRAIAGVIRSGGGIVGDEDYEGDPGGD